MQYSRIFTENLPFTHADLVKCAVYNVDANTGIANSHKENVAKDLGIVLI